MAPEKLTVLVVDDEPDVCTYLSTLLQDNGYSTVVAKDGAQALEEVKKSPPDLITLDVTMPEKSGVKFYREIKESPAWSKIPVVMVTGVSNDFEHFISTRRQVPPPEGYLHKPVDRAQILALAKKLTARSEGACPHPV